MFAHKQAISVGIRFNYLKENRRAWQYCTILNLLSFLLFVPTYNNYMHIEKRNTITFLVFFASCTTQSGLYIQTTTSFIILIRAIYTRFAALNQFSRYFMDFIQQNLFTFSWSLLSLNRNQFLHGNMKRMSIDIHKIDSMDSINFIGYQHGYLTTIVDELNFCYSFQVLFFFIHSFQIIVHHRKMWLETFFYSFLDNVDFRLHFHVNSVFAVQHLSVHNSS